MKHSLPPLTWFRAFEASARHLNFTLAARELNVTQSAVSQHVRALEAKFAVALFERKARGLSLTESGRRLLPYASSAVGELTKATALFAPHSNEERLDVACTTSFAVLWLAPRLRRFRQANAQVTVRILSTLWPDDYLTEKTDVQIRFGSQTLMDDASALLIKDEIVPVCAPGHVDKMGHVDDLWQLPLIETVGAQYSWDRWAQQFGEQSPPAPSLVVDSLILAKTLAEVGYGVALASRLICHDSIQEGKLVVPFDRPVSTNDCFFISASEKAWRKSAARSFHDWLQIEIEASGRT